MPEAKQSLGFTLLEMLVILAIVVILTLLSIPLFSTLSGNQRASGAAETLFRYLQYAQSEAVKQNANVYVSFSTGDSWCYGINLNSACNCTIAGNCSLGTETAPAAQQLTLSTSGLTSNSIYFDGTHSAASTSGTVTFTVYGQANLVTVSIGRLGGLQLCSTGITGYTAC